MTSTSRLVLPDTEEAPVRRFASALLVDPRGWLLLQERDEHPVIDPERWTLPGGHVDDGEDVLAAAHRELEEETGLQVAAGTLRPWRELAVFHEGYASTDPVHVHVAATTVTDADVDCREGRRIVFVDPATLGDLPLSALAGQALPLLLADPAYAALVAEAGRLARAHPDVGHGDADRPSDGATM